jgi:hypothetical protein
VQNGILRVACIDDFHYSTLKRNQQYLTQLCNTVMGTQLAVHPVLQQEGSPLPVANVSPSPAPDSSSSKPLTGTEKEHPLIEKLYRDFGAERI